jgi:hypothetical protein
MKKLNEILDIEGDFKRADHVDKILKKHYYYTEKNHKEAIRDYQRSFISKNINHALWEKHKNPNLKYTYNETTKKLDSAIHEFKTPHKLAVYSGTVHDPRELKNSEGIVHHPAYLSTSIKKDVAEGFSDDHKNEEKGEAHILKIHVPKGHPGVYVPATESGLNYEREFILPRGTNLKHIKTTKEDIGNNSKRFTHHMKVV